MVTLTQIHENLKNSKSMLPNVDTVIDDKVM